MGAGSVLTSRRHPAVLALRELRRPPVRREAGVCLVEGPHLVETALEAGLTPLLALATPRLLARAAREAEVGRVVGRLRRALEAGSRPEPPAGLPGVPWGTMLAVAETVFAAVAATETPQGLLAVFALGRRGEDDGLPRWVLALDGVQDPGNVGALARALLAFGGEGALLLTADGTADPWGDKALRASAGALFRLRHRPAGGDLAGQLAALRAAGLRTWALVPRGGHELPRAGLRPPLALAVGSEGEGISGAVLAVCEPLTVPMPGPAESLNAAVAGAIALYTAAVADMARA
jgi:TrmH family RNA methyltransferase